jgi:4-hydroxy-tetrahydrodipicolinate reductase
MKVGLIGFGKTGKAVASVILQNKEFSLSRRYSITLFCCVNFQL